MNDLPHIVSKCNLRYSWKYRDEEGKEIALVARYDDASKKRFHQYRLCDDGQWIEGAPTPLPIYGLDTLPKSHIKQKVYIFEGEKCAAAAHHLGLSAITSMMGSGQVKYADWAILAKFRHVCEFVLIPDNDNPGHKYIEAVAQAIQRSCPSAKLIVCQLPLEKKGDDFVDWIQAHSKCPTGWDGFSAIDEPHFDFLKNAFEDYVSSHSVEALKHFENNTDQIPTFDSSPDPIQESWSDVSPCPIATLPKEVADWIQGIAKQMQIAEDFFVAPLLVYLGSLIGRKRGLRLRQDTSWIEFPNLWGIVVGRPSMMKSPAMKAMLGPLEVLGNKAIEAHEILLEQYERELEAWKIRKKACEESYKSEYKSSLKSSSHQQNEVKFHTETMLSEPKKRRYKTQDATTEKLGELLADNPQGLLVYRDELAGWLNSFEKNGREGDRQFFLESWSGNQAFDVDRIGRGSLHVPALCLSIFGSIQPGPLSQYIRSAIQGGSGDDGFIQRFQVMVWPDGKDDWKLIQGISISELEAPINRIFDCLDSLTFDPIGQPSILSFSMDAQVLFDKWQEKHEKRVRAGDLPPHMEAHLAKYKKLIAALCLILEHIKEAVNGEHPLAISVQTLESAICWLEYFESHANRIYGSGANAILKAAKGLINHLRKGDVKEPFTIRDIYHGKHWSGLGTAKQVEEVVDYLVEKQYLARHLVKSGGGRPTEKYWANPQIYEEAS
ncbi:DUF3987 domain-containing protein [Parachlamydia acanthamoebae]|jgi:hypothetical protein|uniref:DUF3987 domain-containing protein n=1 Tax=Parachlamydia acanthamoebae TaxID=83552 RepID=UPI0024E22B5F|nr:DUF3987 domain-containing protein [Parachlamydia acanthamoebae]